MENEHREREMLQLLSGIKKELIISNSLPRKFFSAIIYGLGTVVGATILVTLLLYVLSFFADYGILSDFNTWLVETLKH